MSEPRHLDGNAAAGQLQELFAMDVTAATGECVGCHAVAALATARMYGPAPGLVLRCHSCDEVLLRATRMPSGWWLDLRGVTALRLSPS